MSVPPNYLPKALKTAYNNPFISRIRCTNH